MSTKTIKKDGLYYITIEINGDEVVFPIPDSHVYNAVINNSKRKAGELADSLMRKYQQKVPATMKFNFYAELRIELTAIMDKHAQLLGL